MYFQICAYRVGGKWILKVHNHIRVMPETYVYEDFEFRLWFSPDDGRPILFARKTSTDKMLATRLYHSKEAPRIGLELKEHEPLWMEIVE